MVLFLNMTGTNIVHVPYKSGNAGMSDTSAGHVSLTMGNMLAALPHVKSGRLRAYGVTTKTRAAHSDDRRIGGAGLRVGAVVRFLAPAGTPRDIVMRLHRDILKVTHDNEVKQRFMSDGAEAQTSKSPEEFGACMRAEVTKWAKVVAAAKIEKQ